LNRRNLLKSFRNGKDVGSFSRINFEIVGHTELGKESILFDTDIHYLDLGEGEPVLLVHGIGQSLFTWRNNFDFLVKNGYRAIAVDLAGFGYSSHPNIYYTSEEYALIIEAFLDSLNIKRAHIAAFSTGCASSLCFAAANPKRAGKLILVSPGAPNSRYPFLMKALSTGLGSSVVKLHMTEASVRKVLHDMYFDTTNITNEVVEGYFAPYRNKTVRETLSMCMIHLDDAYARSLLKEIKSETLVFYGTDDKLHDEKTVSSYASVIPKAKLIKIRNSGHLLHEEKSSKFNSEILSFLSESKEASENVTRRSYRQQVE
jgi:pimeloyl-ACP methyl ester carboxylesterase